MENKLNKKAPIMPTLMAKNEPIVPIDPFIPLFAGEYYFCIENSDWDLFLSEIKNMELRYNKPLNSSVYESCLAAYAKSFNDGYCGFVGRIKTDEVFDLDNNQKAERIVNRVEKLNIRLYPLASIVCGDMDKKQYERSGVRSVDEFHKAGFDNGEYYKAVEIINTNRNQFESFFSPQQKAETEPEINELKTDYSDLLNALSKYITGIRSIEFTNIIEHHSLLNENTPKASWISCKKVDAHNFATFINMTMPEFKKCFSFPDGKKLTAGYKDRNNLKDQPIIKILKAHLNK